MDSDVIKYSHVDIVRQDIRVLRDVNLTVSPGELVFLTGKVGSGKSSLLKTMYAEVKIAAGDAHVLDRDMRAIPRREIPWLRREIGVVFQDFRLLSDRTVSENLEFVLRATGWRDKDEIASKIEDTLASVGMPTKGYKMPYELSGGEQQRIVIARAMLNTPRLLLADEPTGNLDPETGLMIIDRLAQIAAQGTTVVIATHNTSAITQFPGREIHCENRTIS